ncbi:hypothetical protein T4C_4098, partial [Trichinella pseudospiralis]
LKDIKAEINFKCIMPKLKKGATPSELVKGVTANRMLTIGRKTEPAYRFSFGVTISSGLEQKQHRFITTSIANSHSQTQCYRFHIFVHSITKWTWVIS